MKVYQLPEIDEVPAGSPLRRSPIWQRDVAKLSHVEMLAFFKRCELRGIGDQATKNLAAVTVGARLAIRRGLLNDCPAAAFDLPGERLSTLDIRQKLHPMSRAKQDAILFALATGLSLIQVETLRWPVAHRMTVSDQASAILKSRPHHLKTNLVFWENARSPKPLHSLGYQVELVGSSMKELAGMFARIPPFDPCYCDETIRVALFRTVSDESHP